MFSTVYRIPLNYHPDSTLLFEKIRQLPYPVFLDSGRPRCSFGRYDILCAAPKYRVITDNQKTQILDQHNHPTLINKTPFAALSDLIEQHGLDDTKDQDLPFNGGILGYFSYDLGRCIEHLPEIAATDLNTLEMQVGLYLWAIIVDHQEQTAVLVYRDTNDQLLMEQLAEQLHATTNQPVVDPPSFQLKAAFRSNLSSVQYRQRFHRIIDYISAGDCYQVNLAQRFNAPFEGDSWQAYRFLRQQAPTPFSAYMSFDETDLLSLSPERFLSIEQLNVETKPIKGTRPRGASPAEDLRLKQELSNSQKDRAENLMIVDLLRNDLSKTCELGSVEVPKLFAVESYANVHHLVSTVTGKLKQATDGLKLLEGSFPGGSITGAPKIRSMEIIEELEPHRRSIYCGSIGYMGFNGKMDTNICIRTLIADRHDPDQKTLYCWAGGGIVADSDWQAEYQETFDKISNLINPLQQHYMKKQGDINTPDVLDQTKPRQKGSA